VIGVDAAAVRTGAPKERTVTRGADLDDEIAALRHAVEEELGVAIGEEELGVPPSSPAGRAPRARRLRRLRRRMAANRDVILPYVVAWSLSVLAALLVLYLTRR
jgi:hypothetical protein